MIFLISDTHFGHKKLIDIEARKYKTIDEHDNELINNWNSTVSSSDVVYHLGDFAVGCQLEKALSILKSLNGKIRLIPGNHDSFQRLKAYSDIIKIEPSMVEYKKNILFSHIPVHPQQLQTRAKFNFHGHLHTYTINDDRYKNVSCEQINYTPINIQHLENEK